MQLRSALKVILAQTIPAGLGGDRLDVLQNMAIAKAVDSSWFRIQDVTFTDLTLNGTLQRWSLIGADVAPLPASRQMQPTGVTGYAAFSTVTWTTNPDGSLVVEPLIKADGTACGGGDAAQSTISATKAPTNALGGLTRLWYARRVPQPITDSDLVRLPDDYARAMSLFSYCELLALSDSGSDIRDYKTWANFWQQEASLAYEQAVPPVLLTTQDLVTWG